MSTQEATETMRGAAEDEQTSAYKMLLFIVDGGINSLQAIQNLNKVCDECLPGECDIQIIDVVKDFEKALKYNVLVTPCIIVIKPPLYLTILGDLNDPKKFLAALGRAGEDNNGH